MSRIAYVDMSQFYEKFKEIYVPIIAKGLGRATVFAAFCVVYGTAHALGVPLPSMAEAVEVAKQLVT